MPDTAIGWGFRNRIATQYGDRFANDTGMFLRMLAGNPHAEIKITYSFDSLCSYGGDAATEQYARELAGKE